MSVFKQWNYRNTIVWKTWETSGLETVELSSAYRWPAFSEGRFLVVVPWSWAQLIDPMWSIPCDRFHVVNPLWQYNPNRWSTDCMWPTDPILSTDPMWSTGPMWSTDPKWSISCDCDWLIYDMSSCWSIIDQQQYRSRRYFYTYWWSVVRYPPPPL